MATKSRGRCVYTRFDKKILCAGTLDQWLVIERRIQSGGADPESLSSVESFTTVAEMPGKIEKRRLTARFDGVNVQDSTTHVGYINYDQTIFELDRGSLWIRKEGTKDRRFKLDAIAPYDEDDLFIEMDLTERGFIDKTATEA